MTRGRMWIAAILLLLIAAAWFAVRRFRAIPIELRATLHVEKADLGIPGITKVYDASIRNWGAAPVRVTRCNFIDDGMSHGTMVAYAIQRWNQNDGSWQQVLGTSRKTFCHPYPLGIVKADLEKGWLWPGQSLSIGEEATAARDVFNLGDKARFVIFTGEPGDYTSSIATEAFTIDEDSSSDTDFRVRH